MEYDWISFIWSFYIIGWWFADVIKIPDQFDFELIKRENILGGPRLTRWHSPAGLEEVNCHVVNCLWKPHGKEIWVASRNWELTTRNRIEPLVIFHKEMKSANTSEFEWGLWVSDKIVAPANTLILGLWDPEKFITIIWILYLLKTLFFRE